MGERKKSNKPKRSDSKRAVLPASSHDKFGRSHWRDTAMSAATTVPEPVTAHISPGMFPALVLNADYTPLSYVPLSVWSWQDTMKAIFRDVATVLSSYDKEVSSPSIKMQLPSVIVLKQYVPHAKRKGSKPAFTRRNLYLRDCFCCRYCGNKGPVDKLTYDHVVPRAKNGPTSWTNVVTACKTCNLRKGDRLLENIADMKLSKPPHQPTWYELQNNAKAFPPRHLHEDWVDYVL